VIFAAKHPVAVLAMFFAALYVLVLLMAISPLLAFAVAAAIGIALFLLYLVEGLAPYVSLDCRDGRHAACVGYWCTDCPHTP
jgi:hypothetical protein